MRINDRRILAGLAEAFGFAGGSVDGPPLGSAGSKQESFFIALDKLDKIGVQGVCKELETNGHGAEAVKRLSDFLRILGTDGTIHGGILNRQQIPAVIADEVWQPLQDVISAVTRVANGAYNIRFDPTLVRGMGYYTGQIFEITSPGYSASLGGGGRYDKMVGKFLGRDVPACGFSIGFERVMSILSEKKFKPPKSAEKLALIFEPERDSLPDVLAGANALRSKGAIVSVLARKKDMRKQLDALVQEEFSSFAVFKGANVEPEIKALVGSVNA